MENMGLRWDSKLHAFLWVEYGRGWWLPDFIIWPFTLTVNRVCCMMYGHWWFPQNPNIRNSKKVCVNCCKVERVIR